MLFTHLIYASQANNLSPDKIEEILAMAQKNNKKYDITGALLFNSKYFLQYIEGRRENVNNLYHNILNDDRHKNTVIIRYDESYKRLFPDWQMLFIGKSINNYDLYTYSLGEEFLPHNLCSRSAYDLFSDQAKHHLNK